MMNSRSSFLTAEWRKLAIFNYEIAPALLHRYLPQGIEFDFYEGKLYASLVGFMFLNTKLKGIAIPFHQNFEEVNLRFYVKRIMPDGTSRRGVTFIKELVPKPAISLVANLIYKEPYETVSMNHSWKKENGILEVEYGWKKQGRHSFSVSAEDKSIQMENGSVAEFITEHYWGYTQLNKKKTSEYPVEHPRWEIYPVTDFSVNVDFEKVYGKEFGFLTNEKPVSVLLAEGSEIVVRSGAVISSR